MDARIKDVLDSGWYLSGKYNEEFAGNFAKYCGTKHAVGVANGLDAINLIIRGWANKNVLLAKFKFIEQNKTNPDRL